MRILIVEDDGQAAEYIRDGLCAAGHNVDVAHDGQEGLVLSTAEQYDLLILDRRLPKLDGLALAKAVRAVGINVPILFVTTMSAVDSRVEGLDAGADDYLIKPFVFSELVARANALMRRPPLGQVTTTLRVADLEIDLLQRRVTRQGQSIDLLPREFRLLEYLMRNAERVVTRTMLLEQVWDFHFDPKTSVVETHISRLRAKVDRPFDSALIHTVPRAGYSIHAPR